jgi:autotransporter-associated beta strand protein
VGSGGMVNPRGQLVLGNMAGGSGTFNLNTGGSLEVGGTNGIVKGGGTATFNLAGGTITVYATNLTTAVPVVLSNTSTIDTNGLSFSLSGSVSGTGSLSKLSAGTLTFNGTNTYSGSTTVHAGTLESGPTGKFTASSSYSALGGTLLLSDPVNNQFNVAPITLDNGTLKDNNALNGISQLFGNMTLADSATIDFGAGTAGNIFEFSGFTLALSFTGLNVLNWNGSTGAAADHLVFDSGTFSASDLAKISFYNSAGQFTGTAREIGYGASAIELVPEPSSAALLVAGVGLLGTRRPGGKRRTSRDGGAFAM